MGSRSKALALYKQILQESKKFTSYNYRNYAIRKTRDEFRQNKEVTDPQKLKDLFKKAKDNLEIVQRQVLVGQMYDGGHLVFNLEHFVYRYW
ncbi:LYR motif-containing protein 4-like isoform X1 [Mytilus galloprovincialis]|uniref:LYR motif-containing protein 4-like isoform X1 n=1 Tax=Mytilus galloprovincialis TaxID=29158 RepID=UPI003F7B764D